MIRAGGNTIAAGVVTKVGPGVPCHKQKIVCDGAK